MMILFSSMSFAQNAPITFETGGHGSTWTWTVFENNTNPALEIIDNPFMTGINTSAKVAKFTALQAGNPWAGVESLEGNLGTFTWNENNRIVKIMVYKSVISDVGIKFDAGAPPNDWSSGEIKVANTKINEWEELTFDFSNAPNPPAEFGGLKRIIIFPDFAARSQDNIIYFDSITFHPAPTPPVQPATAAPTPTRQAANVISLFSDAYTDVTVETWRTTWSAAALEDVSIEGNATKKYSSLDFVGIETVANKVDASEMTHLHLDVWSADFTFFGVKLVDFGADGAFGGGDDAEHQVNFTTPAQGEWVSLDIPLSDFTGLTTRAHLAQYILVGQPTGATTVFIDNVYFYKDVAGPTEPETAAPTPTRQAANVISLFSDAYTDVTVDTWRTTWSAATLEDVSIEGNPTKKYSGLDFVGIETVANKIDATEMTHLHLDVWSANFTFFGVKLVDFGADGAFGGGDDTEHQVNFTTPAQGEWVSLDIPLNDFTGLTARAHLAQYILVGQPTGATTVFVDNVYFFKDGTTSVNTEEYNDLVAYPNPVNSGVQVQLNATVKKVDLYDVNGKLIRSLNSTSVLGTDGLSKGIYIMNIQTLDGKIKTQRLIIN